MNVLAIALGILVVVLTGVLIVGYSRYASAERRITYLERKIDLLNEQLQAEKAKVPSPTAPSTNIEELANATRSGDPVAVSRKALDMGLREAKGALRVVEGLTRRSSDKQK